MQVVRAAGPPQRASHHQRLQLQLSFAQAVAAALIRRFRIQCDGRAAVLEPRQLRRAAPERAALQCRAVPGVLLCAGGIGQAQQRQPRGRPGGTGSPVGS